MNVFNGGKPPDDIRPTGAISGLGVTTVDNMDFQDVDSNNKIKKTEIKTTELIQNNPEKQVTKELFLYETTDISPFCVLVENKDPSFKGKLNPIKVNEIIFTCHPELDNKIKEIESAGRNRIRVLCKDAKTANNLVLSKYLKEKQFEAYIPKSSILKQGVIKGIDVDITEEFLKKKIRKFDEHCKFTVENVRRITKAIVDTKDNQKKIVQTKSIIVTFKTQILPKYIALGHVRLEVNPYVQRVILCYNCFRYGHSSKQCKSKKRCLRCMGDHKMEECNNLDKKIACFHCRGSHATNEIKKCQEFNRQKEIKTAMAYKNFSYKEAEKFYPQVSYASIAADKSDSNIDLDQLDEILNNSQNFENSNNNNKTTSPYFTQIKSPPKRARPTYPNSVLEQHKQILSQASTSQPKNSLLSDVIYQSNLSNQKDRLRPLSQNVDNQNLNVNKVVELVLSVLNILRQNKNFDINKQELVHLINTKLSSSQFY